MRRAKPMVVLIMTLAMLAVGAAWVSAGDLAPPAGPDDPGSAMHTLEDAYNRLNTGAAGTKRAGGFAGPSAPPGATGRTLDEVMARMPAADNAAGASPNDVAAGKTFWGLRTDGTWGPQTGSLATTDSDLLPDNIKEGVTIFGVVGNYNPGWNLHTTTSATALFGVDMLSSADGWAVGWGGRFYRWDGTSWNLHTDLTYDVYDVEMLSSTDGWAVGPNCIYHWDGTSWSVDTTVLGVTFQAVSMVSSDDGWAVGSGGHIYRYSGGVWTEFTSSPTSSTLYDVDMVASDDGWMVNYNGYFYHWDGSGWSSGGTASAVLYCVDMLDASHGWAGGSGGRVFRYSGGSWGLDTDIDGYSDRVNGISMVSSTEGWAVGDNGHIFYYDGTAWSEYPISMGSASIHGVDMLSSTDGAAVGGNGLIYDYDGAP